LNAYIGHTNAIVQTGNQSTSNVNNLSAISNLLANTEGGLQLTSASHETIPTKKQKVKRKKDPNAPKAPPTAYFFFAQEARPKIKEAWGPNAKGDEITQECAKAWNDLPPDQKDVRPRSFQCLPFTGLHVQHLSNYRLGLESTLPRTFRSIQDRAC